MAGRAGPTVATMRHTTPDSTIEPTSVSVSLMARVASVGFALAGLGMLITAYVDDDAAPRSAWIVSSEEDTRDFLDQRAAAHLRQLRDL